MCAWCLSCCISLNIEHTHCTFAIHFSTKWWKNELSVKKYIMKNQWRWSNHIFPHNGWFKNKTDKYSNNGRTRIYNFSNIYSSFENVNARKTDQKREQWKIGDQIHDFCSLQTFRAPQSCSEWSNNCFNFRFNRSNEDGVIFASQLQAFLFYSVHFHTHSMNNLMNDYELI